MYTPNFSGAGFDTSHTSFINPAEWLVDYTNTYTVAGGKLLNTSEFQLYTVDGNSKQFFLTEVSIQAIPEPATASLMALTGLIGFFIRRHLCK